MTFLRYFLFPFSFLFVLITEIRNGLYSTGIIRSSKFDIPVIVVGNLSVGGTGKSPMTDYLVSLLKAQYKPAVLSRGYGRKSNGYYEAQESDSARDCGDEPLQIKRRHPDITVAVESNRVQGIIQLVQKHPNTDLIVLDDAFQHRALQPGISIVLIDYNKPFFTDFILPVGNLRELRKNIKRADVLVVTKFPENGNEETKRMFNQSIRKYSDKPVFFSSIQYSPQLASLDDKALIKINQLPILLVTGIANPKPLLNHLKSQTSAIQLLPFADHHFYTEKDIDRIASEFEAFRKKYPQAIICTTEKDAMRLLSGNKKQLEALSNLPVYVQKINTFIHEGESFNQLIHDYICTNTGNHLIPEVEDNSEA